MPSHLQIGAAVVALSISLAGIPAQGVTARDAEPAETADQLAKSFWVADAILKAARLEENGYAGLTPDHQRERIDLWWKGAVDHDVWELVSAGRADGLDIRVHQAPRSRAEMRRNSLTLLHNPLLKAIGATVNATTAPPDQSGIDLYIDPLPVGTDAAQVARRALKLAVGLTGVPVRSVVQQEPVVVKIPSRGNDPIRPARATVTAPNRQNDNPTWGATPAERGWRGGAAILPERGGTPLCTTGFAVTYGASDVARMLSAYHCDTLLEGSPSYVWRDGTRIDLFANPGGQEGRLITDSLLLNPTGNTAAYVYRGDPFSSAMSGVKSFLATTTTSVVATSGASGGTHLELEIVDDDFDFQCTFDDGDPESKDFSWNCPDGVWARIPNGRPTEIAVASGDSGGPVTTRIAGSDTRVYARGIIQGGFGARTCPDNLADDTSQGCHRNVAYFPLDTVFAQWGGNMTLKTAPAP